MTFGYDLAGESVALFQKHENHIYDKIDTKNKAIEKLVDEMEKIEHVLTLIAERTEDSKRLEMTTPEDQQRLDSLRQNDSLRPLFPEGKSCWKGEEIANLTRKLNQHVEGPLQRKIQTTTEEIMLHQNELTKTTELFNRGVQRAGNLTERILSNMARS